MKIYQFLVYLILFLNFSSAQEAVDKGISEDQDILKIIDIDAIAKKEGWDMKGVVKVPTGRAMVFQMNNKILGYCVIEREKRLLNAAKKSLSGTTKIVFGDPSIPPKGSFYFTITDPEEIALWVEICQNHMQEIKYRLRFFSLNGQNHFSNKVVEVNVASGRSSHQGLHFISDNDARMIFSADSDELDRGEFNGNPILMSLVSAKLHALKHK